jgi:hemin uptake protein HemP
MQAMNRTPTAQTTAPPAPAMLPDRVDTRDLFRDRQVVLIKHAGELYQLRLTKNGKLILTK